MNPYMQHPTKRENTVNNNSKLRAGHLLNWLFTSQPNRLYLSLTMCTNTPIEELH